MASDEAYMDFLNKANEDASGGGSQQPSAQSSGGRKTFKTTDSGSSIPREIQEVCSSGDVYVSEADEPFEPVSLKWSGEGGLPDEVEFAKLIQHWEPEGADITILDPTDWDRKGQYQKFVKAVTDASQGNDVRVYKVVKDQSRVEFWLVSRSDGRIVGVKALSVET